MAEITDLPDLQNIHLPKVGILVGSLRAQSWNMRLAQEAEVLLAERADVEIIVPDMPLFSEDYESEGEPLSPRGREIRETLRAVDALLVCSPEYDRLPPAIILNVCHWASRPPDRPLQDTPVMLAGVSSGQGATRASRPALRLAFERIGARVLQEEIFVGPAEEVFWEHLPDLQAELSHKLRSLI